MATSRAIFLVVIITQICHKTKVMDTDCPTAGFPRFKRAQQRLDEENSRDPNLVQAEGVSGPRELIYTRWLMDWVRRLKPNPSEELLLAARGAHVCRWSIPRESYPMDRAGYLRWRQELKKLHASKCREILQEVGYAEDVIGKVLALVSKSAFPADPDSRTLEDALCLVFLERQFAELAQKSTDDKIINALQKTWKKMTPLAREHALKLPYGSREKELLNRALGPV